ncbi:hypothetical protein F5887DRAFT_918397 [Amanita rubescens]|nr:hypothetical protein F5887DRAFT_918397 [Amanita rubescens]
MLSNFLRLRAGLVYPILSLLPTHSLAFSLELNSIPQQCSNLTITASGLNSSIQYAALVVPYGPSPLPGGVEVRQVLEFTFDANSTTADVPINYPSGSQFVIAMIDSTGLDGTSQVMQVQDSNDASCFSSDESITPPFSFNVYPQFTECSPSQIWWDNQNVPGYTSLSCDRTRFTIICDSNDEWSELVLVGGEPGGLAVAQNVSNTVIQSANTNCSGGTAPILASSGSVSATSQAPTGFSTAFASSHTTSSVNAGGSENDGVLGASVAILSVALLFFFLWRRRVMRRNLNAGPIDLVGDSPSTPEAAKRTSRWGYPQELYTPRPFLLQSDDMSDAGSGKMRDANYHMMHTFCGSKSSLGGSRSHSPSSSVNRPPYGARVATPDSGRKCNSQRQMRAINVIQHVDAELVKPLVPPGRERETIELPPMYTNARCTD